MLKDNVEIKQKTASEYLEEMLPKAANLLMQDIEGKPVNPDRIKNAKFIFSTYKGTKVLEKENRKLNLSERRFNFSILLEYGDEKQNKRIREMIAKSTETLKLL